MLLVLLCEDKPIQLKEYCTIIQNHIMINELIVSYKSQRLIQSISLIS